MNKMSSLLHLFFGITFFFLSYHAHSSSQYLLCGTDEDGCQDEMYEYCVCIPYNEIEAEKPFCLDFESLKCTPLSQTPTCDPSFIYKNQNECMATIYQSQSVPPCTITTQSFCLEHHSMFCASDGDPSSCHY